LSFIKALLSCEGNIESLKQGVVENVKIKSWVATSAEGSVDASVTNSHVDDRNINVSLHTSLGNVGKVITAFWKAIGLWLAHVHHS